MGEALPTILNRMLDRLFHVRMMPVVLFGVCFLSYGVFIRSLGFYRDDWAAVWVWHSLGKPGLLDFAAFDRPFQGWIFSWTSALLGEVPFRWHVFTLFIRWFSAVALWWSLRAMWPRRTTEIASVALLFAIYPGFTFLPLSWIYGQSAFLPLTFSFLSIGAMVLALRCARWFWVLTPLAVASAAFSLMITEYFFGLEILRPVFLWLVIGEETEDVRRRLRRTLAIASPYLMMTGMYLIWRLFVFKSIRPATDATLFLSKIAADPLHEIASRFFIAFKDVVESGLMAWGQTFRPDMFDRRPPGWLAVFIGGVGVALYLWRLRSNDDAASAAAEGDRATWAKQAVGVGLLGMFVGALPVWFGDHTIELETTFNRFTLATMFGASVFFAAFLVLVIKTRLQQVIVLGVTVALAIGYHMRNARFYRENWTEQKALFWQLSWRAPALKPGTAVLKRQSAVGYDDDSLTATLNFLYGPEQAGPRLDYWFFNLPEELLPVTDEPYIVRLRGLTSDGYMKRNHRSLSFEGLAFNSLVVRFSPPSCVRVVDVTRDDLPQLHPVERAAAAASHVDRIDLRTDAPSRFPPRDIMGPEPEHGWCYYFEKAELFRQMELWQKVARLGDEARKLGLTTSDGTEWLPFIEAYANTGRYGDAAELTRRALDSVPNMQPALYHLMARLERDGADEPARKRFIVEVKAQRPRLEPCLNCFTGY